MVVQQASQENYDFKFYELRKLRVCDRLDVDVVNNVAVSSALQIVFVASPNVIKAISVNTVLDFQWSKESFQQIVDSYPSIDIPINYSPHMLTVNGGRNEILFVFGCDSEQNLVVESFNVQSVLTNIVAPLQRFELPPTFAVKNRVLSVAWHPEFNESLLALATTNGAIATIVIDSKTYGAKILSCYMDSIKITSVSWSPKGKQLVAGSEDGKITQYKHSNGEKFTKAKVISLPPGMNNFKVVNVNWVHSSLFQVVYLDLSGGDCPNSKIIFIYAPPKVNPEYFDFGSVCVEDGPFETNHYYFQLNQVANVLLCMSSHSPEVSVIGCSTKEITASPAVWSQWILEDASRIELQIEKFNPNPLPLGMAWYRGPTNIFKISETATIGGQNCPLIFVFSSSGVLCPYYAVNSAGNLVLPDLLPSQPYPIDLPAPMTPTAAPNPAFGTVSGLTKTVATGSQFALFGGFVQSSPVSTGSLFQTADSSQSSPAQGFFGMQSQSTPSANQLVFQPQYQTDKEQIQLQLQVEQPILQQLEPNATTTSEPSAEELRKQKEKEEADKKSAADEAIELAIIDEMVEFNKEFKKIRENLLVTLKQEISSKREISKVCSDTNSLSNELQESAAKLVEIDMNTLRSLMLEPFAIRQEVVTRMKREDDPLYSVYLSKKPLDPISERKIREIRELSSYIENQLNECNSTLDQDWDEFNANTKVTAAKNCLSKNVELLYSTLSNTPKLIEGMRQRIKKLESKVQEEKGDKPVSILGLPSSALSRDMKKIIDSLEDTRLDDVVPDFSEIYGKTLHSGFKVKILSKEHCQQLNEFFEQHQRVPMHRTVISADVQSSKFTSAIVKARQKLKKMKVLKKEMKQPVTGITQTTKAVTSTPSFNELPKPIIQSVKSVSHYAEPKISQKTQSEPTKWLPMPVPIDQKKLTPAKPVTESVRVPVVVPVKTTPKPQPTKVELQQTPISEPKYINVTPPVSPSPFSPGVTGISHSSTPMFDNRGHDTINNSDQSTLYTTALFQNSQLNMSSTASPLKAEPSRPTTKSALEKPLENKTDSKDADKYSPCVSSPTIFGAPSTSSTSTSSFTFSAASTTPTFNFSSTPGNTGIFGTGSVATSIANRVFEMDSSKTESKDKSVAFKSITAPASSSVTTTTATTSVITSSVTPPQVTTSHPTVSLTSSQTSSSPISSSSVSSTTAVPISLIKVAPKVEQPSLIAAAAKLQPASVLSTSVETQKTSQTPFVSSTDLKFTQVSTVAQSAPSIFGNAASKVAQNPQAEEIAAVPTPSSAFSFSAAATAVVSPTATTPSAGSLSFGGSTGFGTSTAISPPPAFNSSFGSVFCGSTPAQTSNFPVAVVNPGSGDSGFKGFTSPSASGVPTSPPVAVTAPVSPIAIGFSFDSALKSLGGQSPVSTELKNPFGVSISAPNQIETRGLFGNQASSLFKSTSPVAQAFGAAASTPTAPAFGVSTSAFGSGLGSNQSAATGSSGFSTFGAPPSFGASSSLGGFGQPPAMGSGFGSPPIFGQSSLLAGVPSSSPFGNYANSNSQTFGALAASTQQPTFEALGTQGQQSGFGFGAGSAATSPIFGNTFTSTANPNPAFASATFSQRRA